MKRIIPISLLVFWAMQFALQMIAAIKGMPLALFSPFDSSILASLAISEGAVVSVLAVVSGVIASAFAWAAVTVAAGGTEPGERGEDVTRVAFCCAIGSVTILSVLSAANGTFIPFQPVAMLTVALAVSWIASVRELETPIEEPEETHRDSQRIAALMAGDAAHKSMLGTLSGRKGKAGGAL